MNYYANKKILIATKHQKEKVIGPIFEQGLACITYPSFGFDTDVFGTFSGEIKREKDPLSTCILKAKSAAASCNFDFVIANEGSFAPHPQFPFIPSDFEVMVFIDLKNDWIISEHLLSTETNYQQISLEKDSNYDNFLQQVGFPAHGLIIRDKNKDQILAKGIQETSQLTELLKRYFKQINEIQLETDMRALFNPTRIKIIALLADSLLQRVKTVCDVCYTPGFGIKSVSGQLECEACGFLTERYKNIMLSCIKCDNKKILPREDGLKLAEQRFCPLCNP